jgi:hypothetical protein
MMVVEKPGFCFSQISLYPPNQRTLKRAFLNSTALLKVI